jgi:transcriptional regulator with XRE-family HTH domain
MTRSLSNYLRTHRKRASLSQAEIAFLVGTSSGAKICRYENAKRQPSLETALAYEALFGVPLRELFAGVYQKVEGETRWRAQEVSSRLEHVPRTSRTVRKLAAMSLVAGSANPAETVRRT